MAKRSARPSVPISLRFSPELRSRVKKYAASRGLEEATAIRALCTERLLEIELTEDLIAAERWQLDRAMESWDKLDQNKLTLHSQDDILRVFSEVRPSKR